VAASTGQILTTAGPSNRVTTHTHAAPSSGNSITSGSNLPAYQDLKVIQYSGMPTTLPAGVIAFFDDTPVSGSWTQVYTGSRIIRGASSVTTGGSDTHTHTMTIGTSGAGSTTSVRAPTGTGTTVADPAGHTHAGANNTSDSVDIKPPYREVMLYKLDSDASIPQYLIGLFDAAAPTNWDSLSGSSGAFENRFLRGTSSYGGTGGTSTHSHTDVVITTGGPSSTATAGTGSAWSASDHTHTYTVTLQSGVTHLPPYTDTVIAKYNPPVSPTIDQKHYRWRDDTGALNTSAGWAETEDTKFTDMKTYTIYRLRFSVANTGDGSASSYQYRIRYAQSSTCSSATYTDTIPATATTEHFEMVDSSVASFTDGADITSKPADKYWPGYVAQTEKRSRTRAILPQALLSPTATTPNLNLPCRQPSMPLLETIASAFTTGIRHLTPTPWMQQPQSPRVLPLPLLLPLYRQD
jgi:hypothetical protein